MKTKLLLAAVSVLTLAGSLFANSDIQKWDEKMAISVLAIDNQKRAEACQALAVIGGPDSVPALSWLLDDPQLASYARTALEVIDHPSAGQALLDALDRLEGVSLIGAATSLGVRGEEKAVSALQALAKDSKRGAAKAALVALARIGNREALATVEESLKSDSAELRKEAAHAALIAAELQSKMGDSRAANSLLRAVRSADIPDHIKQAAAS